MRALGTQARAELTLSLRQGEQLLVSLGIPVLLLVFFSVVDILPRPSGQSRSVQFLVPGILALAIMSSAMVSLGIGTGFERQYHVLKRLGVTPLGRPRLIAAKVLMVLALQVVQVVVLVGVGVTLGWRPEGTIAWLVPAVVLGTAAFAGIGLLLAGTLPGLVNLAVCNGLYLVLLLFGGMVFPLDRLPAPLEAIARLLPAAALTEVMHLALGGGSTESVGLSFVVLTTWAILAPLAAVLWFRWD